MNLQITTKNIVAWILAAAPGLFPLIITKMSPGVLYTLTLVAVYAFHVTGQWLAAVNPSIKAQAETGVTK